MRVVGFFAHPDDETVLAGGLAAMLVENGADVHMVVATRGEGGELGEPPVVDSHELLGRTRENELRCAVQALGASLTILDYVDPRVGEDNVLHPFNADFDTLVEQFANLARDADVILAHGVDGEYGHPAHKLVNQAVMAMAEKHQIDTPIYTIAAFIPDIEDHIWNKSQPAHFVLDISPWAETKIKAMECHESQHALFKRRRKLNTVAEALRHIETVRKVWTNETLDDRFAILMETVGARIGQIQ